LAVEAGGGELAPLALVRYQDDNKRIVCER